MHRSGMQMHTRDMQMHTIVDNFFWLILSYQQVIHNLGEDYMEIATIDIQGKDIQVFKVDETLYVKLITLHKDIGTGSSFTYKKREGRRGIPMPPTNRMTYFLPIETIESEFMGQYTEGIVHNRLKSLLRLVPIMTFKPFKYVELKQALPVETQKLPKLPDGVSNAEDIKAYVNNLAYLWNQELAIQVLNTPVELPEGVDTQENVRAYTRKLHEIMTIKVELKTIESHFISNPFVEYTPPPPPESKTDANDYYVGHPLPPGIVESQEDQKSIRREYNLLVNFIVDHTSEDFGTVKSKGYAKMREIYGINLTHPNATMKPVDMIQKKGWWYEAYRALYMVYARNIKSV